MTAPAPQPALQPNSTSAFRLAPVAAAAFSAGILLASFHWRPPWLLLAALAAFAAATIVFLQRRPAIAYALSLFVSAILGSFVLLASESSAAPDSSLANLADGSEITLVGHVVRDGVWRESPFRRREQSIDLEVESVADSVAPRSLTGTARLTIFSPHKTYRPPESDETDTAAADQSPTMPLYLYGQCLRLTTKLRRPINYGNPGAFDYSGYLREQGITANGSARADNVEVLPGISGSTYGRLRSRIRRSVIAHIHRTWLAQQAALFDAMLIGERETFDFGGARFDVLAPARDWELKSRVRDDDAMVLRLTYGANAVYLPGDSGKRVEDQLAPALTPVDLRKIAHHGSVTSTTPELLNVLHPKFAVISVGAQNSFRHPRPEVLERLQAAHVAKWARSRS